MLWDRYSEQSMSMSAVVVKPSRRCVRHACTGYQCNQRCTETGCERASTALLMRSWRNDDDDVGQSVVAACNCPLNFRLSTVLCLRVRCRHRLMGVWNAYCDVVERGPHKLSRLNGSSGSVNGDLQFLWDRQISYPYKINTPEPIDKKFGTVDYVCEGTLYTKFDTNPPSGGFWANGWNITTIIFYLYLFFSGTHTGQTRG